RRRPPRHRRRPTRRRPALRTKDEHGAADPHPVARVQRPRLLAHALAVEERAGGAAEILELVAAIAAANPGVEGRHTRVTEDDIVVGRAADRDVLLVELVFLAAGTLLSQLDHLGLRPLVDVHGRAAGPMRPAPAPSPTSGARPPHYTIGRRWRQWLCRGKLTGAPPDS